MELLGGEGGEDSRFAILGAEEERKEVADGVSSTRVAKTLTTLTAESAHNFHITSKKLFLPCFR
jgi:hypothetical protein